MPLARGARRDAVHGLLGRARHRHRVVRRRGDRRRRRPVERRAGRGSWSRRLGAGRGRDRASARASPARRSTATAATGCARVIGAISESIGEYGGKVVLATPIEAILGTPVDAPRAGRCADARQAARSRRREPLAAPLTVGGLAARLGAALQRGGREARAGRCSPRRPGRSARSRPQTLRPGLGVRRRLLRRRHRRGRDRDGGLRRRRPASGASGTRSTASARALAAAPGRLRLPRDQQPDRDRRTRPGTYKSPRPATRSGRSPTTGSTRSPAASARSPPTCRCASSPPTSTPAHASACITNVADESAVDAADRRLDRSRCSRRSRSTQAGGTRARRLARAPDRRRVLRDRRCARRAKPRALLQPLRDRRARPARRRQRDRRRRRAADLSSARWR